MLVNPDLSIKFYRNSLKNELKLTVDDAICRDEKLFTPANLRNPVLPKFHEMEAHLVDFLLEFNCGWPYSEEGIEQAHHWIRLFWEKTAGVTGYKNKLLRFADAWVANQSNNGVDELNAAMHKGRKRAYKPRPNRAKTNLADLFVEWWNLYRHS